LLFLFLIANESKEVITGQKRKEMKKKIMIFVWTMHDFFLHVTFFLFFFFDGLFKNSQFFPFFLFLIAILSKKILPEKNEGKKWRKMNSFFVCACLPPYIFYVIASQFSFLSFFKKNPLSSSFRW
jgi:hypothetical protein